MQSVSYGLFLIIFVCIPLAVLIYRLRDRLTLRITLVLAALDVCGAPALVARYVREGMTVVLRSETGAQYHFRLRAA